mgnify:CR=1 FL=1
MIGYGSILKIKNGVKYVISNNEGILRVITLVNGKLKLKYNQVIENVLTKNQLVNYKWNEIEFKKGDIKDFNNYWLTGFIDSNGSFQIKILNKLGQKLPEIKLKLQISEVPACTSCGVENREILEEIRKFIININNDKIITVRGGGINIGTRKHILDSGETSLSYYWETSSFRTIKNVICYLNKYPLQSSYKYINYLYLYKAYLLVQNKEHLSIEGVEKIKKYKKNMR